MMSLRSLGSPTQRIPPVDVASTQTSDAEVGRRRGASRWLKPVGVALLAVGLAGCFGPRKDHRRYFTLPLPKATPAPAATPLWPGPVQVTVFDIAAEHDHIGLALRRSPVELAYSDKALWARRPNRLVSDRFAAWLAQRELFAGVVRDLGELTPKWVLRGRVSGLEVLTAADGGGPWRVRLALSVTLRSFADGKRVWRGQWDHTRDAATATPQGAATALTAALHDILADVDKGLRASGPAR